ncbi:MAG TPA: hypothetical protein VKT29_05330 [Terriglobales bacterium]|nr:hypothetical protein [Terriglobales bacterium]
MESLVIASLEERLARLEKQGRRWRTATLLLLLAVGVLMTAAFSGQNQFDRGFILPPHREGIRARAFLLTDGDGNVHGEWSMQGDQPVLQLFGKDGKVLWVAPPRAEFKPAEAKPK